MDAGLSEKAQAEQFLPRLCSGVPGPALADRPWMTSKIYPQATQ
jgi:hypothetical protein